MAVRQFLIIFAVGLRLRRIILIPMSKLYVTKPVCNLQTSSTQRIGKRCVTSLLLWLKSNRVSQWTRNSLLWVIVCFSNLFFIFFVISLFTSCSTKQEVLNASVDKTLQEKIESIIESGRDKFTSTVDISVLDGKIHINEIEYDVSTDIDSITKRPIVKKETNTFIDINKRDTAWVEDLSNDSTRVYHRVDMNESLSEDRSVDSNKNESSFMSNLFKITITVSSLIALILLIRVFEKKRNT